MTSAVVKPASKLADKITDLVRTSAKLEVSDILGLLTKSTVEESKKEVVVRGGDTPLPQVHLGLSADEEELLESTLSELSSVRLPDTARELTADEVRRFVPLFKHVKALAARLASDEESFKKLFNNHFNRVAERRGVVDGSTPTDKNGNWVTSETTGKDYTDLEDKVSRSTVAGGPDFDVTKITELYRSGQISSTLYGRLTKEVRVVDHVSLAAEVSRKPELAELLQGTVVDTRLPQVRISIARNKA